MATRAVTLLLPLILASLNTSTLPSQQLSKPAVDIRRVMTAAEFQQAGLAKLTEAELDALNGWVAAFALKILTQTGAGPTADVIESQIDGDFEGWEGETIFKLTNGQIWQQTSYAYHYHYAFMPDVLRSHWHPVS